MTSYKPYSVYKPSTIEWLGDVPEHWQLRRLKFVAPLVTSKLNEKPADRIYLGLENIESGTGRLLIDSPTENVESSVTVFQTGDVLFGKLRPYLAKVVHADFEGVCTSELMVLRPIRDLVHNRFLFYFMLSHGFISVVDSMTYGAKMPRANPNHVSNLLASLPSLPEQRAIAVFLDRETAHIDALITKKRELIDLLERQRTAIISHTVTKGLDPDAPMKHSGVEWIGNVPEHWKVFKLKWIVRKIGSGKTPKGGGDNYVPSGVFFLRSQNVHFTGLRLDDVVYITEDTDAEMTSSRVFGNDVLLNITGASLGRCSLVPSNFPPANVNQHVCIIRAHLNKLLPRLLNYALMSYAMQFQIFANEDGISREGLNFQAISNMLIALPININEQNELCDFLDGETARIDRLTVQITESISLLEKQRTALISAAVTGKIDVRLQGQ
ncbi:MAG: restriction endonuclease subunit S [Anaerolineales bacterium]|nr:restriction endonuclease subunit S [Anaerolineales bacterium]